jgi:hypothetical protein
VNKEQTQDDLLGQPFEPKFSFTDLTIIEADGEHQAALSLMWKYGAKRPWCLRSDLTISHPFGFCNMTLEFHDDGRVIITDFFPSNKDAQSNFDLRCLRAWTEANGWKVAEPTRHVVQEGRDFWKHIWSVWSVNSEYLDEKYGKRPDVDLTPIVREQDDDGEVEAA